MLFCSPESVSLVLFRCTAEVNSLQDLKTFCDDPKNNKKGLTFRSHADRKKYVTQTLGLKIVKNPRDGSDCVPVLDKVVMLSGHRRSTQRVKEESFQDKEESKEAFEKAAKRLKVETNSKVRGPSWARIRKHCPLPHVQVTFALTVEITLPMISTWSSIYL